MSMRRARDLTWLVALGAALWGLDGWLRLPLAENVAAPTVVVAEHIVLVLFTLPFLGKALRALGRADLRAKLAVLVIGAGSSATATVLFTLAFSSGDFVTPMVIQKLQPLFAILGAVVILGERIRARFALFAVPALIGVWLLAFPNPFHISISRLGVVLLALGAAVLWAAGTVLGRMLTSSFSPVELTTLRFAIGLPTAALIAVISGDALWVPDFASSRAVIGLALIPGLLALILYYIGLRRTAASRATLAEMAFPVTGALVGILIGRAPLTASQWAGVVVIVLAVTALSWHESTAREQAVVPAEPDLSRA